MTNYEEFFQDYVTVRITKFVIMYQHMEYPFQVAYNLTHNYIVITSSNVDELEMYPQVFLSTSFTTLDSIKPIIDFIIKNNFDPDYVTT